MLGAKYLVSELTDGSLYQTMHKLNGMHNVPNWIDANILSDQGVSLERPRVRPEINIAGRRVMDELASSLYRRGVVGLLRHSDRSSMRFSVESRVPFLTLDMANMLLSMPENFLISPHGETKHVFRAAMRGIVPDAVLNRKDKIGFATPEREWLFSMEDTVREWLRVDLGLPFLRSPKVLQEFDAIQSGRKAYSWQIWRWVNFYRWYQQVF